MCGRAAQSASSANDVTKEFGVVNHGRHRWQRLSQQQDGQHHHIINVQGCASATTTNLTTIPAPVTTSSSSSAPLESQQHDYDNFNLSPGMDAAVIFLDRDTRTTNTDSNLPPSLPQSPPSRSPSSSLSLSPEHLRVHDMKWGLVTKNGTSTKPLYENDKDIMKMCFERLCYNARSDTLFEKTTFAKLTNSRQSCIVAFDGYFEWKTTIAKLGQKQPYFVYRRECQDNDGIDKNEDDKQPVQQTHRHNNRRPLLMPGLWTRVSTGRVDQPTLYSFTILTTEACDQISWLHHRMPICIWDTDLAKRWLEQPSPAVLKQLDDAARSNKNNGFAWHKVTPKMTSLKYRSSDAICEYRDPTQSVRSFFAAVAVKKNNQDTTSSDSKPVAMKEDPYSSTAATTTTTTTTTIITDRDDESNKLSPTSTNNQQKRHAVTTTAVASSPHSIFATASTSTASSGVSPVSAIKKPKSQQTATKIRASSTFTTTKTQNKTTTTTKTPPSKKNQKSIKSFFTRK
jgi:putative SOS response-associated peptidase YedK